MDLTLTRKLTNVAGVFGDLTDETDSLVAVTLEHSYNGKPKLPGGIYVCKRGTHHLDKNKNPFETFEITGVPGHSGILFHVGNIGSDSSGCVLLGSHANSLSIVGSRIAFEEFMALQQGVDTFKLTVV